MASSGIRIISFNVFFPVIYIDMESLSRQQPAKGRRKAAGCTYMVGDLPGAWHSSSRWPLGRLNFTLKVKLRLSDHRLVTNVLCAKHCNLSKNTIIEKLFLAQFSTKFNKIFIIWEYLDTKSTIINTKIVVSYK